MPEERGLEDRILDVASRMFLEYGYEGTTFQRVADDEIHRAPPTGMHCSHGMVTRIIY